MTTKNPFHSSNNMAGGGALPGSNGTEQFRPSATPQKSGNLSGNATMSSTTEDPGGGDASALPGNLGGNAANAGASKRVNPFDHTQRRSAMSMADTPGALAAGQNNAAKKPATADGKKKDDVNPENYREAYQKQKASEQTAAAQKHAAEKTMTDAKKADAARTRATILSGEISYWKSQLGQDADSDARTHLTILNLTNELNTLKG